MKYPPEMIKLARKHYNFTLETSRAMPIGLMKICINESNNSSMGLNKPEQLKMYSSLEIAEMIKDLDRHA